MNLTADDTSTSELLERNFFGRTADSYDIDRIAWLAAGVSSSNYAQRRMKNAVRFASGHNLLREVMAKWVKLEGMLLEFGVYSGATINLIANSRPGKTVYGFDSFEGLPEDWYGPIKQGRFAREVLPEVRPNVRLVVGWFSDTLGPFIAGSPTQPISLLHIDCDLYSSTKTVFDYLGERIVSGTIIVFDEYFNYPGWEDHEYQAFQELVSARSMKYEYIGVVPSHQTVAVRIL